MSKPIVFISHNKLKEGKLDDYTKLYREVVEDIKKEKPGTLIYLAFVDEDNSMVTMIHLFPDADAMEDHMKGAGERANEAYQYIESERLEVYGTPNEGVLEGMREIIGPDVTLVNVSKNIGGYIRLKKD
jgi:quinol monooxygenase YgiN